MDDDIYDDIDSVSVLDNVTNVVQYAIVSLFEVIRMMTPEQKEYFLQEITSTQRERYKFLSDLCQITHRMLTFSDTKQIFPSLWLVMCIGEHQTQLSILHWFSSMAADNFLFDQRALQEERRREEENQEEDEIIAIAVITKEEALDNELNNISEMTEDAVSHIERHMLWEAFLWLGVHLLNAENLKLEQMTDQKRTFIEGNFGDLRHQVCEIMITLWSKLDDRKLSVADQLVLPLLRLTDSEHEGSRAFGSTTYFDILRTEFQKTQALHYVENYTIDAVTSIVAERDYAVAHGMVSHGGARSPGEGFLELFTSQLENKFRDDDILRSELPIRFLEGIKKLFVLLSALSKYESSPDSSVYEDERAASMLSLMNYLRITGRVDMRIKYVKKLTSLHKSLGSHVEAGNVILMTLDAEDKLSGSGGDGDGSGEQKNALTGRVLTNTMSHLEIQLTEAAVASFKQGDDWQRSLQLLERLRKYYESISFEFDKLAAVLEEQASLYRQVHSNESYYCSFFRVSYMGMNWDDQNRNKVFVYRGGPLESIMAFVARIKRKEPSVSIVSPGKETPEMEQESACYLQISSVKPTQLEKWNGEPVPVISENVPKRVSEYKLNFNVSTFAFSRPYRIKIWKGKKKEKSKNEFMDLWSKTIMLRTQSTLPGTTRRSLVTEVREIYLNPLEVAVNAVRDKNSDLENRINEADQLTERNATQSFTMAINGTVDGTLFVFVLVVVVCCCCCNGCDICFIAHSFPSLHVIASCSFLLFLVAFLMLMLMVMCDDYSCCEWWNCKFHTVSRR